MKAIVIGLAIATYTMYLIYRKVKSIKAGNYCGSCSGCTLAKSCGQSVSHEHQHYDGCGL